MKTNDRAKSMLSRLRCEPVDLASDVREPAADLEVRRRVAPPLRAVGLFATVSG